MADGRKITVVCGANTQVLEGIDQMSVGELRQRLGDVMNIPSPSQAIIGGRTVNDETLLDLTVENAQDIQIEFVKPAGSKG